MRPCFICDSKDLCDHREPEVIAAEEQAEAERLERLLTLRKTVMRENALPDRSRSVA